VFAEQPAIWAKEKHGAVAGAQLALDRTHHDVTAVRRGGLAEPLRLRTRHLDGRLEIDPELFAAGRIARADHKPVAQPLRISDDERLGEDDHFRAGGSRFSNQAHCLSTQASVSNGTAAACTTAT